jgi:hypothetical protein
MSKCDEAFHGLTVVVDTSGPRLYIGRFDVEDERGVLLRDVDVRDLPEDVTKEAYIARTAKFGVFKNTDHIRVPVDEIVSVRRLSEFDPEP